MAVQINRGQALGLLDLTPMMDMVFNLLIFFMVVTSFEKSRPRFEGGLPDGIEAMPLTAKPQRYSSTSIRTGDISFAASNSIPQMLDKLLKQAALNNPARQTVVIRADKRAAWDFVATAMRLCNQAGIRDYSASLADEPTCKKTLAYASGLCFGATADGQNSPRRPQG